MVQASVGFQCPECTRQGAKASPVITARALTTRPPYVTCVLIALNVAGFLAVLQSGGTLTDGGGTFTEHFGLIASYPFSSIGVARGEWYRLFTGGFVHAGLIHLGMNMFVLWIVGSQLERLVGAVRYLSIYVVCLAAGAFAVMLADPAALTVGASGAIFGLMGAAAAYQQARGINLMQSGLGALIVINLVFSFAVPGISIAGHIGGLIGGLVLGWLMFRLEGKVRSEWVAATLAGAITVLLVYGGYWAATQSVTLGHAVLKF
jgi:membrane associated rhomboid family serine protease